MCIVTFFPTDNGFIFTSNRDEKPSRKSTIPKYHKNHKQKLFYSQDTKKGGTWFAVDREQKKIACLLNARGTQPQKNQKKSRGLIPIHSLIEQEKVPSKDILKNTAPFTLIQLCFQDSIGIEEFRWNGTHLIQNKLSNEKPHLWCSDTLYTLKDKQRLSYEFNGLKYDFKEWENVIDFHKTNLYPDSTEEEIKKESIQTISIISWYSEIEYDHFNYIDLIKGYQMKSKLGCKV
jgi:hypothetical protein